MFARTLKDATGKLACELGDMDALQRRDDEAAQAAAWEAKQTEKVATERAIVAASTGSALAAVLEERPELATTARHSLFPMSSSVPANNSNSFMVPHIYGDRSLLTLACEHSHAECVALLCRAKADSNHAISYSKSHRNGTKLHNYSPLHIALRLGEYSQKSEEPALGTARLEIVKTLLAHNASPTATLSHMVVGSKRGDAGVTPLHMATQQTTRAGEMVHSILGEIGRAGGLPAVAAALDAKSEFDGAGGEHRHG